jgi:hypothetical protein
MVTRHNQRSTGLQRTLDKLVIVGVSVYYVDITADLYPLGHPPQIIKYGPNVVFREAEDLA